MKDSHRRICTTAAVAAVAAVEEIAWSITRRDHIWGCASAMRSSSFARIGLESLFDRTGKSVYVVQSRMRAFSQTSGPQPEASQHRATLTTRRSL